MLATEPLIFYDAHDADEYLLHRLIEMLGHTPNIAHRTSSTLSVLALAAAGMGIALVPEPLEQVHIPGLIYRKLEEPDLAANLMLVSRAGETNGAACTFLAMAREGMDSDKAIG